MILSYRKGKPQDSLISAEENLAMFQYIAPFYDGTNRILSLGFDQYWRRRGVAELEPRSGRVYLDVGCGTGDIALEILRQCPRSRVIGIDPSKNMLEIGRKKIQSLGLSNSISLEDGDVLSLALDDDSVDGAISSFCIRNVTNRAQALSEIFRVVRGGGRLVIVELTEPLGPIMRPLFRTYAKVVMPLVTRLMSSMSAYRYLADSMADFPKPELFLGLMERAGFVDLAHEHLTGGIVTAYAGRKPVSG